jgi:hypothetical protein
MPEFVKENCSREILNGIKSTKKSITLDRIKLIEGTTWASTTAIPKSFDPFSNF